MNMMCQGVMKADVKCVSRETTVEEAAVMMRDEGVGFLPICDSDRRVLGTITDRDITIRAVAGHESMAEPIENFMTNHVVACRPGDDLGYAQELMSQEKVSRILCVDEAGMLEGVISLSDIAQLHDGAGASATLRNVSDREVRI
jgi:CBS domain-containing protein